MSLFALYTELISATAQRVFDQYLEAINDIFTAEVDEQFMEKHSDAMLRHMFRGFYVRQRASVERGSFPEWPNCQIEDIQQSVGNP